MNILIFGANGQIGWELQRSFSILGSVKALTSKDLDFSSYSALEKILLDDKPQLVINAAGYTQVDKAESESDLAYKINVDASQMLAATIKKINGLLVHYSTDYVFDGCQNTPYREDDPVKPLNVYGKSKWLSEQVIRDSGCNYIIFRTSWVHSARRTNFIKTILHLIQEKEELTVIQDQIGTPTSAAFIADATAYVTDRIAQSSDIQNLRETYHLCAEGQTSWYDYAVFIIKTMKEEGIKPKACLKPILSSQYNSSAIRPHFSVMDTTKLQTHFNIKIPDWRILARRTLQEIFLASNSDYLRRHYKDA